MEINKLISAEYFPTIQRDEIIDKSTYQYSLTELSSLGGVFALVASSVAKAAMSASPEGGLYRCIFPDGITGHLAEFKDGSGFLGTIMDDYGIAGQARWIPASGASASMMIDPTVLAVAVAMLIVNKKLSDIHETQKEILQFLHQDKESELEGAVNSLADIFEQYHFNSGNELWENGKLVTVSNIKVKAEGNIIFYRKEIANILSKQKPVHMYKEADKLKASLEKKLKYYQLCVYLYSYASFLEVVLSGNYSNEYLNHIVEKINENAYQYKTDYSTCYNQLENYMKKSIQNVALSGIGEAGLMAGKALAKIPVFSKSQVDESFIKAGNKLNGFGSQHGKTAMRAFSDNKDSEVQMFTENIRIINKLSNNPVEVFFDKEQICIFA